MRSRLHLRTAVVAAVLFAACSKGENAATDTSKPAMAAPPAGAPVPDTGMKMDTTKGKMHVDTSAGRPGKKTKEASKAKASRDTSEQIQRQLAKLGKGLFRVTNLDSMVVGRSRPVYVHVHLRAQTEKTPDGLGSMNNGVFSDTIRLGATANVCLSAPKADFLVEGDSGACSSQRIVPGIETKWHWNVTPIDSGIRRLNLRITSLLAGSPYQFVDTSYAMQVAVAPETIFARITRFIKTTAGFIVSITTLVAAASGLTAAVINFGRSKKSDAPTAAGF